MKLKTLPSTVNRHSKPTNSRSGRVSVVLPTMNEAGNVERVFESLATTKEKYSDIGEAIFVLNNTTDNTQGILEDISKKTTYEFVKVIHSEGARGAAIRKGVEVAQGDIVVVMDSDGQYDPIDIPRLVQPIVEDGYFIVVARNHGWANFSRRVISTTFKALTRTLLGIEYVQTGFKAGVKEVLLETIPEHVSGLDIDVRWINNVVKKGYRNNLSYNVAVDLHPRLQGETKFHPLRLALGLLYTTLSLALERRTGKELPFPSALKRLTLQPKKGPRSSTHSGTERAPQTCQVSRPVD